MNEEPENEEEVVEDRRIHPDELTGRRNGYAQLEKQLQKFFRKALIAFAIIGMTCFISLLGFGLVLREIQQERFESCTNQVLRHDAATKALIAGSDQDQANAADEAARKEIRRRRDVTLALIDAISPRQNCKKTVPTGLKGLF